MSVWRGLFREPWFTWAIQGSPLGQSGTRGVFMPPILLCGQLAWALVSHQLLLNLKVCSMYHFLGDESFHFLTHFLSIRLYHSSGLLLQICWTNLLQTLIVSFQLSPIRKLAPSYFSNQNHLLMSHSYPDEGQCYTAKRGCLWSPTYTHLPMSA